MAGNRITAWNADRVAAQVRRKVVRNAEAAGKHLVKAIRVKLAIQGPPRSAPGEAPHKESGDLEKSIRATVQAGGVGGRGDVTLLVGSDLKSEYPRMLEEGTSRMAPRVYLRNTLAEEGPAIARIMKGK